MTKNQLAKKMTKSGIAKSALEIRLYIPTKDELIYMQVGDGDYIDYTQYTWEYGELEDVDGGTYEYNTTEQDKELGVLGANIYDALRFIYSRKEVSSRDFDVIILQKKELNKTSLF